mgnify:CR=1 FL=1
MNKILCLCFFLFAIVSESNAQTTEDSVKRVISKMFIAMKACDGKMLLDCFADGAILQSIQKNKSKMDTIITEPVGEFADYIGKQAKGDLDEQIRFDVVRIDGGLAIAWTPYRFYYKGAFSHCGVDSYQLVRLNGEWKIQYLIDTRRKDGCD